MSDSGPTLKQIQAEFAQAKERLTRLSQEVKRAARLADAKAASDRLTEERADAAMALGTAVWELVKRAEIQLPQSCAREVEALKDVDAREKALAMDISEVLQEGSVGVAPPPKAKRPAKK